MSKDKLYVVTDHHGTFRGAWASNPRQAIELACKEWMSGTLLGEHFLQDWRAEEAIMASNLDDRFWDGINISGDSSNAPGNISIVRNVRLKLGMGKLMQISVSIRGVQHEALAFVVETEIDGYMGLAQFTQHAYVIKATLRKTEEA